MKMMGKLFLRIPGVLMTVLLTIIAAVPMNATVSASPILAAEAFQSDDFNRCSLNTSLWTFAPTGQASIPAPFITGAYTGTSALVLTVPPGQEYTFSNTNKLAPRIMQPATDTDFQLEVKFDSPLGTPPAGSWTIQGILVEDTSTPGQTRWLRFDLDTNGSTIKFFIGYIDEAGALHSIIGPNDLAIPSSTSPLYEAVSYVQSTGTWTFAYRAGDADTWHTKKTFTETVDLAGLLTTDFKVSNVGAFAGSTGTTPPGIVSKVDYFKSRTLAGFVNDANTLHVSVNGSGTVSQSCSQNSVTLTAKPSTGASFLNWTGLDTPSSQNPVVVTMTKPYNIIANFSGSNIPKPFHLYLPVTGR